MMNRTTIESNNSLFKEARHSDIIWWLLLSGLIVLTLIQSGLFTARMWTAWDQSFLFLQQRDAYRGVVSGASLWPNIAIQLFPYLDLTRFDHSGWAVFIITYATAIISAFTVYFLSNRNGRKIVNIAKYLFVFLLFLWPLTLGTLSNQDHVIWGSNVVGSLYYVPLQAFFCTSALSCVLIAISNPEYPESLNGFFVFLSAFLSGLSLFIIPPGGVGCCILVFLLLIGYKHGAWYKVILWFFFGILLSMASVHFLIYPLPSAFHQMLSYASGLTSTSYNSVQILLLYGHCFRDGLLSAMIVGGALFLSSRIGALWLRTSLYVFLVLVGYYYCNYSQLLITPAWLILWGVVIALRREDLSLRTVALVIWPFVIALGTNSNLSSRVLCFCASWLFLWFSSARPKYLLLPAFLIVSFLMVSGINETFRYKRDVGTECFSNGGKNVEFLSLSTKQAVFFEESKRVLDQYGYCPDSSVVCAFHHDLCACYAFDSKLFSFVFNSSRFIVSDKSKMLTPDFLFLSTLDSLDLDKYLREASWGWPEEFDSYHIPAPDDYTDDRILFCRSRLLKEQ